MNQVHNLLSQLVEKHRVIAFIKGTPSSPMCGFTMKVAQIFAKHHLNLAYVDVLSYPEIRQNLPTWSQWPTFPQIFIDQELIGGCDIWCEMDKSGEIAQIVSEKNLECQNQIIDAMEE